MREGGREGKVGEAEKGNQKESGAVRQEVHSEEFCLFAIISSEQQLPPLSVWSSWCFNFHSLGFSSSFADSGSDDVSSAVRFEGTELVLCRPLLVRSCSASVKKSPAPLLTFHQKLCFVLLNCFLDFILLISSRWNILKQL